MSADRRTAYAAVSADRRTAYVTGGFTRDGYGNGIPVVDTEDGSVRRLPAGERPLGVAVLRPDSAATSGGGHTAPPRTFAA